MVMATAMAMATAVTIAMTVLISTTITSDGYDEGLAGFDPRTAPRRRTAQALHASGPCKNCART